MSSGQKPRQPLYFPRMKNRARKRRPTVRLWDANWRPKALGSPRKIRATDPLYGGDLIAAIQSVLQEDPRPLDYTAFWSSMYSYVKEYMPGPAKFAHFAILVAHSMRSEQTARPPWILDDDPFDPASWANLRDQEGTGAAYTLSVPSPAVRQISIHHRRFRGPQHQIASPAGGSPSAESLADRAMQKLKEARIVVDDLI